jgi:hypothetical protein
MLKLAGKVGSVVEIVGVLTDFSFSLKPALVFNGEVILGVFKASEALTCRLAWGVRSVSGVGTDIRDSMLGLGSTTSVAGGFGVSCFISIVAAVGGGLNLETEEEVAYERKPRGAILV